MERIIADMGGGLIKLGRQGEHLAREIVFDISRWNKEYGDGVATLVHRRSEDTTPYPRVSSTKGDTTLSWPVTNVDTNQYGSGECELIYVVGDTLVKSAVWGTFVGKSLTDVSEEVPTPEQSWVDHVIASAVAGKSAYDLAVENGFEGDVNEWLESLRGSTPQKGVDYFTDDELVEFTRAVLESVGNDSEFARNVLFGAATGDPFDNNGDAVMVTTKDDFIDAVTSGKCVLYMGTMLGWYPVSCDFETFCYIDINGIVSSENQTMAGGMPMLFSIDPGYYYLPNGSKIYRSMLKPSLYEIFASELLNKLSNTAFFKKNYYNKQQVDSIAANIRASIPSISDIPVPPDWIACYDEDLWLIDNDACMYKILGFYLDENENDIWCTYPIDLPDYVSVMYGGIYDFPVAIQYRTATMDANTRLFFRIDEEGRATLYRDGEPDTEFYPVGYYYWGYLTDWSSFDLRPDDEPDATGAIVLGEDEPALVRETEEADLGEESAEEGEQE